MVSNQLNTDSTGKAKDKPILACGAKDGSDTAVKPSIRLVRGKYVFTGDTVLEDGAVAIENDTVCAVGAWETMQQTYRDAIVEGGDDFWVIPGLVNAHHHSNGVSNLLQGLDDDFLEPWLLGLVHTLRSQNPKLRTLLSIAYLLKTGVTSVVDVATVGGTVEDCCKDLEECLEAYQEAGIRVAVAAGVTFESNFVHCQDEEFIANLPKDLQQKVTSLLLPTQQELKTMVTPDEYISMMRSLVTRYKNHSRIDVWFGPPGPQWVGDDVLVNIAGAAQELGTQIQTHAMESLTEKSVGPRFHGKSMATHLNDLGVLGPKFSIAHGTWVTQDDIGILSTTKACISHNPSSNLRLRAGVAPLNAMLEGEVTVGLGMDGNTIGDDEDMFAEMRLAAHLHRNPQWNSSAPTYKDIFDMATVGGAALMGKEKTIGKLAAGYKADLVMVKSERFTWPWVAPEADPLHLLMLRAKALDVDTVIIGGEVVLRNGVPTKFDMRAVGQELAAELDAQSQFKEKQELVSALRPHLIRWYEQWQQPTLEPFAAFNSKS